MFSDLRVRFAVIAALVLLSAWTLYSRGITLGLDLQGGTHLALEVSDPSNALTIEQKEDAIDRAERVIRTRVDELGVAEPGIQKAGRERIVVELPGASREVQQRAKDIIQRSAFLQFQIVRPASELAAALGRIDRAVVASGGAITTPTPETGSPTAPPVAPGLGLFEGSDSAATDTTGVGVLAADSAGADSLLATADQTPQNQPFSSKLAPAGAGNEGVFLVAAEDVPLVEQYLAIPAVQQATPRGLELRWGVEPATEIAPYRFLYLLDSEELITGERLEDAQAQRDPNLGQPIVLFQFDRQGGRIFERGTGQNVGNLMAIVLDDEVFSAPVINSQIGERGQIEMGGGDLEAARDLALVLRAGALPAPIEIVEERSVGPSLGQDSIDRSRLAGILGIIFVVLTMVFYYRFSGVMAVVALAVYVLLVLAGLSGVGATLTLPGIAGLILSIGMAVDANVLIFERIREELTNGRPPRHAVNEGFANALSAIVDAQLTTLLTAFVLFQFGTGPVRGFAVTLAIGIIASMFTAIFVTRTFYTLYLDRHAAAEGISI